MTVTELQQWLVRRGQNIVVDGKGGPATRAAIVAAFTNTAAPAVTPAEIEAFAAEIGCTAKQLSAIATVESAGGGFDTHGRPKLLFERHYFYRLTQGAHGITSYSNPHGGGYSEDSWEKLGLAAGKDPDAAFASASWGKFQIMGAHWNLLGFSSSLGMAYQMSRSEAGHYSALVHFIRANHMEGKVKALSTDPATCVAFAKAYNGPGYKQNRYDEKLAAAMR